MTDRQNAPPKEDRPADNGAASRTAADTAQFNGKAGQITPIGPHPGVAVLLVGALLWSSPSHSPAHAGVTFPARIAKRIGAFRHAAEVFDLVRDDDVDDPALAAVLAAMRTLSTAGRALGPQLVLDELRRTGKLRGLVPDRLREATTSGALPEAALEYAAAVVADALRRRIESAGAALSAAATTAAEADLAPLVAQAAASVSDCARRLAVLRGEIT